MDLIPERLEAERSMIFEQRVRIRVLGEIETLPLIDRVAVRTSSARPPTTMCWT